MTQREFKIQLFWAIFCIVMFFVGMHSGHRATYFEVGGYAISTTSGICSDNGVTWWKARVEGTKFMCYEADKP